MNENFDRYISLVKRCYAINSIQKLKDGYGQENSQFSTWVKTMEYFRGSQLHPFDHTSIGLSICKELYFCFSCSLTICWYGLNLSSLFKSYSLKLASLPTKKDPIISLEETISTGWQWFTYFLQKMHSSYNIWSSIFEEQQKEQGKYRRKHMHRIQLSE